MSDSLTEDEARWSVFWSNVDALDWAIRGLRAGMLAGRYGEKHASEVAPFVAAIERLEAEASKARGAMLVSLRARGIDEERVDPARQR